jgi:hypothetical protein
MMTGNIANLISDFSAPPTPEGYGLGILRRVKQIAEAEPVQMPSMVDRQAELIQSIEARVRAEERQAAREDLEKALTAEREMHREELAVQRELWVEQEGLQLSSQIIEAVGNLEAILSEKAARILASVVPEALRQSAIAEFNEALGTILSGEPAALMKVTGPEDLLKALQAGMALREGIVEFVPGDDVDVTLVSGDTVIQTQFSAWSERLQAALKAEKSC